MLPGQLHQAPGNQGPGQGGGKRIAALIEGVGPDGGEGKFRDEGFDQVGHDRLAGAGIKRLLANWLQFIALAQVGGEGDHLLHPPFLDQIRDTNAGIHPAGVSQHHLFCPSHARCHRLNRGNQQDSPMASASAPSGKRSRGPWPRGALAPGQAPRAGPGGASGHGGRPTATDQPPAGPHPRRSKTASTLRAWFRVTDCGAWSGFKP